MQGGMHLCWSQGKAGSSFPRFLAQDSGREQTVRSSLLVYKGTIGKLSQVTAQGQIQEMPFCPEASPRLQRKDAVGSHLGGHHLP